MTKFKVGDRVRVTDESGSDAYKVGEVGTVERVTPVEVGNHTQLVQLEGKNGSAMFGERFELVAAAPAAATLTVRAGAYYKTRDGRKVGPVRFSDRGDAFATADGFNHDHWYTQNNPNFAGAYINASIRGERADDLVAEWVDEPVVAEQAWKAAKVGDRVTVHASGSWHKGKTVEVTAVDDRSDQMRLLATDGVDELWLRNDDVVSIVGAEEPTPAAIAPATAAVPEPTPTVGSPVLIPGWITSINHSPKGTVYGVAFETKNRRASLHFLEEDFITVDEGGCPCFAENDNGPLPLGGDTVKAFDALGDWLRALATSPSAVFRSSKEAA